MLKPGKKTIIVRPHLGSGKTGLKFNDIRLIEAGEKAMNKELLKLKKIL